MRIETSLGCDICYQASDFYHAITHFYSKIESHDPSLPDAIILVIPLGKDQFDLAVQQESSVQKIRQHFTDMTYLRLLSSDSLFAAEFGRPYAETASKALTDMKGQYILAASKVFASNDTRLIEWFNSEVNRIDKLFNHFVQQHIKTI